MNRMVNGWWPAAVALVALVGCGGGGGIGVGTNVAGISRLGISSGPVTGFGSIFVSDSEFGVGTASFDINDDSAGSSQSDLSIGDFVIVTFDPSDPTNAVTVFADSPVEGIVFGRDLIAGTLVVAGQTVIVDVDTIFDNSISPALIDSINIGDFVEVSGQFDADGNIRASRIEPGTGETEVRGMIETLDSGAMTLTIKMLNVNFASAVIDDRITGGNLAIGDFIEVKGAMNMNGSTLDATKIEPSGAGIAADDSIDVDMFDEIELESEGIITRFVSSTDFDVAGSPVTTNGNTEFIGGVAGDLGLNVKVEVEGKLDNSNVLVATKVDIRRANALRVTALVDSVDATGGTFDVLGITVRVDSETRIEDKSNADDNPFSLAKLVATDYVEVRGGTDISGGAAIIAAEVRRDDVPNVPGKETEIRGFVDTIIPPTSFTILGVTIEVHAGTVFRDAGGMAFNNAGDFFAALTSGDAIEAVGTESSQTTVLADEIQFE